MFYMLFFFYGLVCQWVCKPLVLLTEKQVQGGEESCFFSMGDGNEGLLSQCFCDKKVLRMGRWRAVFFICVGWVIVERVCGSVSCKA